VYLLLVLRGWVDSEVFALWDSKGSVTGDRNPFPLDIGIGRVDASLPGDLNSRPGRIVEASELTLCPNVSIDPGDVDKTSTIDLLSTSPL
jgi:hypothetical protein